MSEVKWIKLLVNMFDDDKIEYILSMPEADAIIVIWVRLLTLAGKCNAGGYVFLTENIPYTDEMLADKFHKPLMTVRMALEIFNRLEMIEFIENKIFITNFEKHQNVEGLDRIKEQTRIRVANYRAKLALPEGNVVCNVTRNVTVTHGNAIEEDIDIDKDNNNIYSAIFEFWNSKNIIHHKKLSDKARRKIKTLSESYSLDEFKKAIANYEQILHDPKYYWTYVWTLDDFLTRGFEKFLTDACFNNYLQKDPPPTSPKGPANKGNFEQRHYSDEYFNQLYKE
jgi:predicted phage replisome organizer